MADLYLPDLGEGWEWHVVRHSIDDHPKVRVALLDPTGADRAHGTIDVEFYGDGSAVLELARALVARVAAEQLAGLS